MGSGALGGSGFLAVYLVGLALGDAPLSDRDPAIAFHRGLAMVAEIGMFFALGLLVFPSQFGPIKRLGGHAEDRGRRGRTQRDPTRPGDGTRDEIQRPSRHVKLAPAG